MTEHDAVPPLEQGTIEEALADANRAIRRARAVHRALGVPWVVWGPDGVTWIAPEDLPELALEDRGTLPDSPAPPIIPERKR